MNNGRTIFAQLMGFLPYKTFERYALRQGGSHILVYIVYIE